MSRWTFLGFARLYRLLMFVLWMMTNSHVKCPRLERHDERNTVMGP